MLGCTSEQNPQVQEGLGLISAQSFMESCGSFPSLALLVVVVVVVGISYCLNSW